MKRLRRILRVASTGAITLSALLCILTTILWVRSYSISESIVRKSSSLARPHLEDCDVLGSFHGRLNFLRSRLESDRGQPVFAGWTYEQTPYNVWLNQPWPQFVFHHDVARIGMRPSPRPDDYYLAFLVTTEVRVPHWFVACVTSMPPAIVLTWRWYQRRRIKPGCCKNCGYDLRASPQRCPECGTGADVKALDVTV